MRTVLVTGADGFVGQHLCAALLGAGVHPFALSGDIRDQESIVRQLDAAEPDAIVHLAALASVADSWSARSEVWDVNATGTNTLVSAVRERAPRARMLAVSSAEVYGIVPEIEQPIAESHAAAPRSPYAVSKLAAEATVLHSGLDAVVARPFPHLGPGQDERFAIASFAAQIARIERGDQDPVLRVGNLDARRDLLDVRCVAEAYVAVLQGTLTGLVNVASGVAWRIGDVLDRLLSLATVPIMIEIDPARLRPADVPLLAGDATRLREATGWRPRRSLDETLSDTLETFRRKGPA